jgi:hypothetical protein
LSVNASRASPRAQPRCAPESTRRCALGDYGSVHIRNFTFVSAPVDSLTLQASAFSCLTPGMTEQQEAVAVLSHATGTTSATITDSQGNCVTFDTTSLAYVTANLGFLHFA